MKYLWILSILTLIFLSSSVLASCTLLHLSSESEPPWGGAFDIGTHHYFVTYLNVSNVQVNQTQMYIDAKVGNGNFSFAFCPVANDSSKVCSGANYTVVYISGNNIPTHTYLQVNVTPFITTTNWTMLFVREVTGSGQIALYYGGISYGIKQWSSVISPWILVNNVYTRWNYCGLPTGCGDNYCNSSSENVTNCPIDCCYYYSNPYYQKNRCYQWNTSDLTANTIENNFRGYYSNDTTQNAFFWTKFSFSDISAGTYQYRWIYTNGTVGSWNTYIIQKYPSSIESTIVPEGKQRIPNTSSVFFQCYTNNTDSGSKFISTPSLNQINLTYASNTLPYTTVGHYDFSCQIQETENFSTSQTILRDISVYPPYGEYRIGDRELVATLPFTSNGAIYSKDYNTIYLMVENDCIYNLSSNFVPIRLNNSCKPITSQNPSKWIFESRSNSDPTTYIMYWRIGGHGAYLYNPNTDTTGFPAWFWSAPIETWAGRVASGDLDTRRNQTILVLAQGGDQSWQFPQSIGIGHEYSAWGSQPVPYTIGSSLYQQSIQIMYDNIGDRYYDYSVNFGSDYYMTEIIPERLVLGLPFSSSTVIPHIPIWMDSDFDSNAGVIVANTVGYTFTIYDPVTWTIFPSTSTEYSDYGIIQIGKTTTYGDTLYEFVGNKIYKRTINYVPSPIIPPESHTFFNKWMVFAVIILGIAIAISRLVEEDRFIVFLSVIGVLVFMSAIVGIFPKWIIILAIIIAGGIFTKIVMGLFK